jgi:inosose dehydratase
LTQPSLLSRVAAAPISWGVSEVPGWGWQMPAERVLDEMSALGLLATELGPPGFLPGAAPELRSRLAAAGLRLVAGFLAAELHQPDVQPGLEAVAGTARVLAGARAEVLVLAAAGEGSGYERRRRLGAAEWGLLAEGLGAAREVTERFGFDLAVHPHVGTLIEGQEDVDRLLELTDQAICLDTGHLTVAGVDPLKVAVAAGDRVRHVHLKDVDATLVDEVRAGRTSYGAAVAGGLYRPLGQGSVDLTGLVERLEAGGYRGWYVLEEDVMLSAEPELGRGPLEGVRESLGWFQELADRPAYRASMRN